jgi:selenocysteine lyase/cysteine desulfurase
LADQFPSNVYCWQRLAAERLGEVAFIEASADGDLTTALLAALDERTDIVAVPHCRWTDGRLVDLERIGARAREVGAALVVDATQSLGVLPLDVTRARPDFLVAAGYKWLLGPYSLGWLYVAPEWRAGRPLEANWIGRAGAEDFGRLVDYREDHAPGARRFDVGERSNFALLPAALASLELLLEWTPAALAERLAILTASIAERLAPLGLVTVPPQLRGPHFLGLALPDGAPADLTERLAAAGVFVSRRGSSLRVTPHADNDEADVERLATALAGLL